MPEVELPPSDPSSWARSPQVMLLLNGESINGVIRAEVTNNGHYASDCFAATVAIGPNPLAVVPSWSAANDLLVDLRFSLNGASFAPLIRGSVDSMTIDPIMGVIRVEGRDLSASLIETRTQENFSNRTSSEIAEILAARHGLFAVVSPTTTPVGRYYQNEHDRITLNQFSRSTTEWDLLVFLARQEGFDVFVQNATLYFQPRSMGPLQVITVQAADLIELRLKRSLTLARDIEVIVKSWNSRLRNAFIQTARATSKNGVGSGPPQRYVLVRPNLTPDQALKLAQQKLAELTIHERTVELTMPGELAITPRTMLSLYGTHSDFDQLYFVDVIERHIHADSGFVQHIRAKNSSPRSETTTPTDDVGSRTDS